MSIFSKISRRFLISYIIILIIPNITGYISYRVSIDAAKASSIEASLMLLKQSKEVLERRMAEVEGFTRQLSINQDMIKLINERMQGNLYNVYGLWKNARDMISYSQTNDFLENFYIYLNNYNVILAQGSAFYRLEHYYELYHYNNLSFNEWEKTFLHQSHHSEIYQLSPFTRRTEQTSVITFIQSLPLDSFNNPQATVVIVIDEKKISSFLGSISDQYNGWAHITDSKGNTLLQTGIDDTQFKALSLSQLEKGSESSEQRNNTIIISIRSEKNGWLYTAGIPKQTLMKKANTIKHITWSLTAVELLVGLLIGFLLAYRNSAPLKQLENDLKRQIPLLRDAFVKRLIASEFQSTQEIMAIAAQTKVGLIGDFGNVGIVQINGYGGIDSKEILNELSVARLVVKKMLEEIDNSQMMTNLGSDQIVILFTSSSELDDLWQRKVEQILERLTFIADRDYRMSITVAMGSMYQSLFDISRSFDEAKQAIEYAIFTNKDGTIWYQNITKETVMYYYPIELEQRLQNTIKVGDFEEVKRIITNIFHLNFEVRELSLDMKNQLIGELKGTMLKLLDQKTFQDSELTWVIKSEIVQILPTDGIEQFKIDMEKAIEKLCNLIVKRKHEQYNETIDKIKRYIEEMYMDPELSLFRIAEQVGKQEKYISQFYKEQTGDNLSDYLEKLRISKASELLTEKRLTIDEIALSVGYHSSHSFRRAFKRILGILPSTYRQSDE
ncbi:AraC family transcriptional regulator [Paenibacillus psychroresistens]|uniref:AraC family transcriptional regulator n=1 Tax=Paenibacillus psychroresistens TaxID=1778678 RepID=A0A6B8RHG1_9BACL|nr:helix-turn-helix domain-containing protein [Paenibacillus psychroresistens]QGQ95164.1 AraC family transcriptional regulator [Paenibacillus psychroresistens]